MAQVSPKRGKATKKALNRAMQKADHQKKMTDAEASGISEQKGFLWLQNYLKEMEGEKVRQELGGNLRWTAEKAMMEIMLANILSLKVLVLDLAVEMGALRRLSREEQEEIRKAAGEVEKGGREDDGSKTGEAGEAEQTGG